MTVTPIGHIPPAPGRTADVLLAEMAVLGTAIDNRSVAEAMIELLPSEECFTVAAHRGIYSAIRHLAESGGSLSPSSVLARLVATEQGVWKTGQAGILIADLIGRARFDWELHARAMQNAMIRRDGDLALDRAKQILAETADEDLAEAADRIRCLLDRALDPGTAGDGAATAGDLFVPALERLESGRPPGVVRLPWVDMQHLLGFLRPGQLVTIAARPSLGKSLMALDIARFVGLENQIPAVLFTMEQDRDEVMDRLIAAEAGVMLHSITTSGLSDDEWNRIAAAQETFARSALVIDDTPQVTLAHIRARLRGMARRDPAQVAIIDYLQLMAGAAGENRQREVSALVGGLKAIAREFRIPVIMLCQLNRGPESRHDKRPYISDARESGAVENDSDIAILIHREDHYEKDSPRAGEADFIVDKNRNGPRATVTVGFQGHYARFVDLARIGPS